MYRRTITSRNELDTVLAAHHSHATATDSRHLITLVLPTGSKLHESDPGRAARAALRLDSDRDTRIHATDASDRIIGWLGTSQRTVCWCSGTDWRIAELAAAVGTLQAGGVAVLCITPEALRLSALLARLQTAIACISRRGSHRASRSASGRFSTCTSTGFLSHTPRPFRRCDAPWPAPVRRIACYRLGFDITKFNPIKPGPGSSRCGYARLSHRLLSLHHSRNTAAAGATRPNAIEQNHLLHEATHYLVQGSAQERRLLVITGARGTGKSALLGRLYNELHSGDTEARVTAPRVSAIQSLVQFSPDARFLPADRAATIEPTTLFIDEAASLPAALLQTLVSHHRRSIIATTTDGYESSGRAFVLRTLDKLAAACPYMLQLHTHQAMRWRADDLIAPLMHEALLLPSEAATGNPTLSGAIDNTTLRVRRVYRDELRQSRGLARAVVELLNSSHYQSTLATVDALLTGRIATFAAFYGATLVGVATAAHEPAIALELHADILANRRRLPDRLLPQLLARCANTVTPLHRDFTRVVRIAVVNEARRHGIGRRLIESVNIDSADTNSLGPASALGAVFADEPGARAFWRATGFTCFHKGQRINPRSGQRSIAVLRTEDAELTRTLSEAASILEDNRHLPRQSPDPARDKALLERLVAGERGLAETRGPVYRLWWAQTDEDIPFKPGSIACPEITTSMTDRQRRQAISHWVQEHL